MTSMGRRIKVLLADRSEIKNIDEHYRKQIIGKNGCSKLAGR